MSDVETEAAIRDSREVIDDFKNKQKSASQNEKTATDAHTLFSATWKLKVLANERIESLPTSKLA